MMGVVISSAVLPATLTLLWSKQNMIGRSFPVKKMVYSLRFNVSFSCEAATLSPILGLTCSLIAWLVTAKKQYGNLSVASTGSK